MRPTNEAPLSNRGPILQGSMPEGEIIQFAQKSIAGDGNCGFSVLGASRHDLVNTLVVLSPDPAVRDYLYEEIHSAFSDGSIAPNEDWIRLLDLRTKHQDKFDQAYIHYHNIFPIKVENQEHFILWLSAQSDAIAVGAYHHLTALQQLAQSYYGVLCEYCKSESAFVYYINQYVYEQPPRQLWLGRHSAILYARQKQISVYIWQLSEGNPGFLDLTPSYYNAGVNSRVVHMLHMGHLAHFDLLEPYSLELDNKASSDLSSGEPLLHKDKKETIVPDRILNKQVEEGIKHYKQKNYKKAISLFKKASEDNDLEGHLQLAKAYFYGKGIPKNIKEAERLFHLVAKNGIPEGQFYFAWVKSSCAQPLEAAKWYLLALDNGFEDAREKLDKIYETEKIMPKIKIRKIKKCLIKKDEITKEEEIIELDEIIEKEMTVEDMIEIIRDKIESDMFFAMSGNKFDSMMHYWENYGTVFRNRAGMNIFIYALSFYSNPNIERFLTYLLSPDINVNFEGVFNTDDLILNGTALHMAIKNNYTAISLYFINSNKIDFSVQASDDGGDDCFQTTFITQYHFTENYGYTARRFTQAYSLEKATVLHYACLKGNKEIVMQLLEGKMVCPKQKTSLFLNKHLMHDLVSTDDELMSDDEDPSEAYTNESSSMLEPSVEELGMGWAARDLWPVRIIRHVTPLHLAARSGHFLLVEYLYQQKCSFEDRDGDGQNVLAYAEMGLKEFRDNYEMSLEAELATIPHTNDPEVLAVLRKEREVHTDYSIRKMFIEHGHLEVKIQEYKRVIDFIKEKTNKKAISSFNSDAAANKREIDKMLLAEKRYFDIERTKNKKTKEIKEAFFEGRMKQNTSLDITDIPARQLITADATSVKESIIKAGGAHKLGSPANIARNLTWFRREPNNGKDEFASQYIRHGDVSFKYIHKPLPGHLGNFFMPIVPKKDKYENIIQMLLEFTNNDIFCERFLARCMIAFNRTGYPIPKATLRQMGIRFDQDGYTILVKICYLTSVKEVTRRMFPGIRGNGEPASELPIAIIHYRALILVQEGFLRMQDVFSQDADYGVFTGDRIMGENLDRTLRKAIQINKLYNEKIKNNTIPEASMQELRRELQDFCGAEEDSDGEGYDETLSAKKSQYKR